MGYRIDYEKNLNKEQYEAVMHNEGPCLVIAGAGTGKTTTLINRVARLIEDGVNPKSILLLTFTKKAAENMIIRCSDMLDERCKFINANTFHAFCLSELKNYSPYTGYRKNFTVIDQEEAGEILNLVMEDLNITTLPYKFPKNPVILSIQSKSLTKILSLNDVIESYYPYLKAYKELIELILGKYQTFKQARDVMDFDDLLRNLLKVMIENDFIRQELGNKYRFIMIDEYQDTDKIQAEIAKMIADNHGNIMAVGDDAQSIYAFRGADFRNIMSFPKLFQNTRIIKIERNYRSNRGILALGNAIMTNAKERYEKNLYTDKPGEYKPILKRLFNGHEQSKFITNTIEYHLSQGSKLKDIAVLFHNGNFSYDLETKLKQRKLPFKKFGGMEIGKKPHIKDIIAFLKVGINNEDDFSWCRILKLFKGIKSKKSVKIANFIVNNTNGIEHLKEINLIELYDLIMALRRGKKSLEEQIRLISNFYRPIFEKKKPYKKNLLEEIDMLATIASNYTSSTDFINSMALNSAKDENEGENNKEEYITLSTIHSAKGLEWDIVFIIYVNDGCMPYFKNGWLQDNIDEEVRIFHVAVTRAKNHLYLIAPLCSINKNSKGEISPFLTAEIISELLEVEDFLIHKSSYREFLNDR
jgi:DNA helicase-2/ATP-dependent DNA helicase PcrA